MEVTLKTCTFIMMQLVRHMSKGLVKKRRIQTWIKEILCLFTLGKCKQPAIGNKLFAPFDASCWMVPLHVVRLLAAAVQYNFK